MRLMGAYLLLSIIAFILIAHWAWRNDSVPIDGETRGLFRMRNVISSDDDTTSRDQKRSGNEPLTLC